MLKAMMYGWRGYPPRGPVSPHQKKGKRKKKKKKRKNKIKN
jgi:hypothetical protein